MNHTHSYRFWHAHRHDHTDTETGAVLCHNEGHYHRWAQTHDHGAKMGQLPHAHQARQAHPGEEYVHHHAVEDHEKEA